MGYTADLDNPQKRTPLSCLRNRNAIPWMSSSQSTLCTDYAINAEIPHSCLVGLLDPVRGGTTLLRNFGNFGNQSPPRKIPEDMSLQQYRCQNLKHRSEIPTRLSAFSLDTTNRLRFGEWTDLYLKLS